MSSFFKVANEALVVPSGRLSAASSTAVTTADVNSAGAVYYTPYQGRLVPIYDGASFVPYQFSELTLTLNDPNHAANSNYDVFVFLNAGTVTIGTGPAWSSGTSRGSGAGTTELTQVSGLLVNNVQITARNGATTYTVAANRGIFLGTIRTRGAAGLTDDSALKRFVSNAFHRVARPLSVSESTASWEYSTGSFQQANANSANMVEMVRCLNDQPVHAMVAGTVSNSTATGRNTAVGIGVDSTSAQSATLATLATTTSGVNGMPSATYDGFPGLGYHYLAWLEYGGGTDTQTWFGGTGAPHKNGLSGYVFG